MATSMVNKRARDEKFSTAGPKKSKFSHIKEKAIMFLSSKENSNVLVELLEYTQNEEKGAVLASIKALHQIFSTLLKNESMVTKESQSARESPPKTVHVEHKYKEWLRGMYRDSVKCLAELISDGGSSPTVQELSLCTLMKFMETENHHPIVARKQHEYIFQQTVISNLVPHLVTHRKDQGELLGRFEEYLEFDDLRFFLLTKLAAHLPNVKNQSLTQGEMANVCQNTLTLLEMVTMPTKDEDIQKFVGVSPDVEANLRILSLQEHRRVFGNAWLTFLKLKLPSKVYKRVLVLLHEKVMPHMSSPVLLTDFLTSSYNVGGAVSLLALNGLFFLITKYNLEYPEFYTKLYNLFEPSIFHVKYKARFFHLADLFLTSTHLPSYLVAAFAKRLARLSLVAPPNALEYVIPFIINLFVRHPNCSILVHRTEGALDFTSDPYNHEEKDPAKSNALESCLWELETLQSHYHHGWPPGPSRYTNLYPS
ncbi:putative nucleolar complex protein 4-like [Apostichopus japonicus]|uniref:Putative nucleolar complex protein 4-like n=1 Tax=Stichopus japonicus TaxID=307972 RepID=A0A2G8KQA2_STIJA|nr:putative nucleolar complex protein 4-like [Apostichopus japonicus]